MTSRQTSKKIMILFEPYLDVSNTKYIELQAEVWKILDGVEDGHKSELKQLTERIQTNEVIDG